MSLKKVELHVHLDGSLRHSTAYELLKKKNMYLPGDGSYESFVNSIVVDQPSCLANFLSGFAIFLPAIVGDLEAIERLAYEFCETKSQEGIIYVEARYCPQLLLPHIYNQCPVFYLKKLPGTSDIPEDDKLTTESIVQAINKGLKRGEDEFGMTARSILMCVRGFPEWSRENLNLCVNYKKDGVVGMDFVGIEGMEGDLDQEDIDVFMKAVELDIHRTVHAGEIGSADKVLQALDILKAERIGHGYRVTENDEIYQQCRKRNVHFECCPTSSLLTGSVSLEKNPAHPVICFARDQTSFSISTDNPTITNTGLNDEYRLLKQWGLSNDDITKANIDALENSFVEEEIKQKLLKSLKEDPIMTTALQ